MSFSNHSGLCWFSWNAGVGCMGASSRSTSMH